MTEPATPEEIVATFNALSFREIVCHNWGTCGRDCAASWDANDETYINGVMLTLDFDFEMGYLLHTVDRTTSLCRYITVHQRHGPRPDGSIDHEFEVLPFENEFFDRSADYVVICQEAVASIYRMHHQPRKP